MAARDARTGSGSGAVGAGSDAARVQLRMSHGTDLLVAVVTDGTNDCDNDCSGDDKDESLPQSVVHLTPWQGDGSTVTFGSSVDGSIGIGDMHGSWLWQSPASAVLVRPDGIVAWIAPQQHADGDEHLTVAYCESQLSGAITQALRAGS